MGAQADALQRLIEDAFEAPAHRGDPAVVEAIETVIGLLDSGQLRVASPGDTDGWAVHAWVKKAILMYFGVAQMEAIEVGPSATTTNPLKQNAGCGRTRGPPGHGTLRGARRARSDPDAFYINIGAYVGSGTMVDTWATVGSCAQIGRDVHLSGGVGIGGVLEPPSANPVIIGDGAFIGSRCIVEGMRWPGRPWSWRYLDCLHLHHRLCESSVEQRGVVPARSVVIPAPSQDVPSRHVSRLRHSSSAKKGVNRPA